LDIQLIQRWGCFRLNLKCDEKFGFKLIAVKGDLALIPGNQFFYNKEAVSPVSFFFFLVENL
jgi:hypothetical protein